MYIHYVLVRWLKYSDTVAAALSFQVLPYELINPVLPPFTPRSSNKQQVSDWRSKGSPALPPSFILLTWY